MSEKWMPSMPNFQRRIKTSVGETPAMTVNDFRIWFTSVIVPLFENAQIVYGHREENKPHYWGPRENGQFDDTHTALVIKIEPIQKEETAEDLLREAYEALSIFESPYYVRQKKITNKIMTYLNKKEETK